MAKGRWAGSWPGGRIWEAADGRRTFIIRRKIGGREFAISTGATTLRAALKQLERFEADPDGYDPAGAASREPVYLDDDLVKAYLGWCLRPEEEGGKGNSREWVGKKKGIVAWWMDAIRGRDLRRLKLEQITRALETDADGAPRRVPGYAHKVEVIKDVFGFLRTKRGLTIAEDPTIKTLLVPQARPGQRKKRRKAFTREVHEAIVKQLVRPWSDQLIVLAGTGWHVTELARFIRDGAIERLPAHVEAHGAEAVLVCPRHKSGEEHRTAVSPDVLEAARRLRARGTFSKIRLYRAVEAGCRAAKVDQVDPGQYRHAVATWALEAGAHPAAVSAFLGHRSPATTKRFYAAHAVVPKVPTLA